jgi:L-lactate dehydrogenase complex protein LldG
MVAPAGKVIHDEQEHSPRAASRPSGIPHPAMSERDRIFGRIREALRFPAPHPSVLHGQAASTPQLPSDADFRRVLPATGRSFEENVALFEKNSVDLKTEFHRVHSRDELIAKLIQWRDAEGWKRVASHAAEWTDIACQALARPVYLTDTDHDVHALEQCDVGITECDALVAQTGSVLVTNRSAGGRALSVLPPHHVVIARREQLLAGLPEAFALLKKKYGSNYPSLISFITGPSRTGDIERILVLGAHGPKKLTVILV